MAITKRLWGDTFVDAKTGRWHKTRRGTAVTADHGSSFDERTFCAVALQPIYAVYEADAKGELETLLQLASKLGVVFSETEKRDSSLKDLRKKLMRTWLPVADALLSLIDDHLPSPFEAQPHRVQSIYLGDVDDASCKAMRGCDASAATMVYISKMVRQSKQAKTMIGFGRVFSGTLRQGDTLYVLDPNYQPRLQTGDDSAEPETGERAQDTSTSSTSSKAHGRGGGRVPGAVPVVVKGLLVVMASKMNPIKEAVAGSIVGVLGLDKAVLKSGTLTSTLDTYPLKVLRFSVSPVVRVSVRPQKESLMVKLQQAMHTLQQEDPCVQCYTDAATGEKILAGVGELNVQVCLRALSEAIGCPVLSGEPAVQFCESVREESSVVCLAKSSNKHNRLYVKAAPLSIEVVSALENGLVTSTQDATSRVVALVEAGFDRGLAKKIVAIHNTNLLVDGTVGLDLSPILDMVTSVFKEVCDNSVLGNEQLRGVIFTIVDAKLHQDSVHRRADQIFPMTRRALFGAIVTASPVLQEPVFEVNVQVPQESLAGLRRVLKDRGGAVVEDTVVLGTPLHHVKAHLAVARSFGFNGDLMSATSGKAFPQTTFSHWTEVEGDPYDGQSIAGRAVIQIRARKRLPKPTPPEAAELLDRL
eukprot:m.38741 g.38741  ORF g.38741 m.38741 type:complete len:643 (-) comp11519_c0_seq1:261-2189(-)